MVRLNYQILHLNKEKSEHTHNYAQIYLPVKAPLRVIFNREIHLISINELGFMPPDTPHYCMLQDDLIVINIPPDMIKKGDLETLSARFIYPIEDSLKPLIELIRAEIEHESSGMRYLYYYLYDRLVEKNSFRSVKYIREHFDEPISVAQLAKLENYNIAYFNDWFKQKTGYTPSHYLLLYRIEKAKELLQYTNYKMIEIAVQVGFGSNAAFCRAFKRTEGLSPAQYRAQATLKASH